MLQPLNLSIFSPLKTAYRSFILPDANLNLTGLYAKVMFIKGYSKARAKALTEKNIKAGFKGTGM